MPTKKQVAQCRTTIDVAEWVDGRATAGIRSDQVKHNMQLPGGPLTVCQIGILIWDALSTNMLFFSAALSLKVFPPLFNRYAGDQTFGNHVDSAVCHLRGIALRVRNDFFCALFLTEPEDYDGGGPTIDNTLGERRVKLIADGMVFYPNSSPHRMMPVMCGVRVCSFFWLQSMVRNDARRTLLLQMDTELQQLMGLLGQDDPSVVASTGMYHNLLREWADT